VYALLLPITIPPIDGELESPDWSNRTFPAGTLLATLSEPLWGNNKEINHEARGIGTPRAFSTSRARAGDFGDKRDHSTLA
jgi:hypothetical protein